MADTNNNTEGRKILRVSYDSTYGFHPYRLGKRGFETPEALASYIASRDLPDPTYQPDKLRERIQPIIEDLRIQKQSKLASNVSA